MKPNVITAIRIVIAAALAAGLAGCRTLQPARMLDLPDDYIYADFKPSEIEYKIQPFDQIALSVSTNDGYRLISISEGGTNGNLLGELSYPVEFDGQVKLPTLGRVHIAGRTLREAEAYLEELYAKYYQNPFILLKVVNKRVYLFKRGGTAASVVNMTDQKMTLLEALAQSGGVADGDKAYKIKVLRGDLTRDPQVFLYNIRNLVDLQGVNLQLEANDIIYVDTRPRYVSRVVGELAPYLSLLSTVLLVVNLTTAK